MNDDLPARAGAHAPARAWRRTLLSTRALMLSLGLLALAATGASANHVPVSWPTEQAMVDEPDPDKRQTFVLDPDQHDRLTRAELLANESYYAGRGFNRNFLVWSEQRDDFQPGGAEWAGCVFRGAGPTCLTVDFSVARLGVLAGPIPAFVAGGAFIARGCGNYSPTGASPMPTIAGRKYEDVDGDGERDAGEPGLAGWTVRLYRDDVHVRSTTTGADGTYAFALDALAGLGPAIYRVVEEQQTGWAQSSANPAAVEVPYGAGDRIYGGNDFGNYRPATIDGVKYEDMEADGDRDAHDPLLAGWTMELGAGPSSPASAVTNPAGSYAFTGLRPGEYTVTERLQAGWRYSTPSDGTRTVTVRSGESRTAEFGNYRPPTIKGVKFDDHDVDRERDGGEPGLAHWTIGMTGGRSPDATDVTDADGAYAFADLIPGTYTIGEQLKGHWRQSAPESGTHVVTVRSGDTATADFGNVCLGTTQVLITDETTGAPIGGVQVRLEELSVPGVLDNDPALPLTTTGTPMFADLLPGTYRVIAFLPAGVYTTDPKLTLVDGRLAVVKDITVAECATTDVPVRLFQTSTGKVTGGMKMKVPGGFASAGYVFMTRSGVPEGSLEYIDHVTGMNVHSVAIEEIHVRGNEAWIGGLVAGADGVPHRFSLHLVDNGEPGSEDRFELLVEPGYRAGFDQTIEGGNDQVHKPERT